VLTCSSDRQLRGRRHGGHLPRHEHEGCANDLRDLASPGNNLEKLKGALSGKYSIRINDQFRIVFNFDRGDASNVVITDYHR
jgi:mRNA-degrading endonuclease RelE of RelBE toxin-antitoxin system